MISRSGHSRAAHAGSVPASEAQGEPIRRPSNRFRNATHRGYAAAEWLGSTSWFQRGFNKGGSFTRKQCQPEAHDAAAPIRTAALAQMNSISHTAPTFGPTRAHATPLYR